MRRVVVALLIPMSLVSATAFAQAAKKFQCWTDNKGVRVCGDTVPPEYAKQEREVIDSKGRVIEHKPRQKTPEEIAAEQAAAAKALEDKRKAEEQARYDRFLLDTYPKLSDLEKAREERLSTVEGQLRLAEKAVVDSEASLKQLKDRAAADEKSGRKPDPRLAKQIKTFETAVSDNHKAVASLKTKREQIVQAFAKDIERYRQIAPPSAQQTPPEPPKV